MTKLNDAMTMSSSEDESGSDDTSDTEADQHDLESIHKEASVDQEQDNKQERRDIGLFITLVHKVL